MRANLDAVKRTVIIAAAMMLALENRAFNALIGVLVIIHDLILLLSG